MVVLCEEGGDAGLLTLPGGGEVEGDGEAEERVLLAPGDEGLAGGAGVVTVEGGEIEARGEQTEGVGVGRGRGRVAGGDGEAPVGEVSGEGAVWGEVEVVVSSGVEAAMCVSCRTE